MLPVLAFLTGAGLVYFFDREHGRTRRAGLGDKIRGTAARIYPAAARRDPPQAGPAGRAPAGQSTGAPDSYVTCPPVQTGDPATDTAIRLAQATYTTEKIQAP